MSVDKERLVRGVCPKDPSSIRLKTVRKRHADLQLTNGRDLVPKNGDINKEFGVYKNLCCGTEIAIPANVTFPDCSNHVGLPTKWNNIANIDRIPHVTDLAWMKKRIRLRNDLRITANHFDAMHKHLQN